MNRISRWIPLLCLVPLQLASANDGGVDAGMDAGVELPRILVGAGDIADCATDADESTARLLDGIPGTVFTLGDNAYELGSQEDFLRCYQPTWGRHRARTFPSAGNHEYFTPSATAYYQYFGTRAGTPGRGYYSYDLGPWHVVVLNTSDGPCDLVSCGEDSEQLAWLKADLQKSRARCTLAYAHYPRFSSGTQGGNPRMQALWRTLFENGVEVFLGGHDHHYERFVPMNADGEKDLAKGVRQFVVGTGGRRLRTFFRPRPANTEVRQDDFYGVLKLTLSENKFRWEFISVPKKNGKVFVDTGEEPCH